MAIQTQHTKEQILKLLEDNLGKKIDVLTDKSVSNRFRKVMEKDIQYVKLHS
jgi:predicted nucleotidyltransferase